MWTGRLRIHHLLTVSSQCDETRPVCQKCQMYGISCDYSAVQAQSTRSNLDVPESPMRPMFLSELGSRIDQALKLASSSDELSGSSHKYIHSKILRAFQHFVTVTSGDNTGSKQSMEVARGDMVPVAFEVCIEAILIFLFYGLAIVY